MTLAMNQQSLIFTPTIISNLISTLKDKAIDIKERTVFSTLHKIISIAFDESLSMKNYFTTAKLKLSVDEMKSIDFEALYEKLEISEENLWLLHKKFKESHDVYEIQLFNLVDSTLDNFAKIDNILGYFESQIIQNRTESA